MDNVTRLLMQGAAGAAGGATYIDDVFSTYLYKGNGNWTTPTPPLQTINTGLDMSGEGGLLWLKQRDGTGSSNHILLDTVRGANKTLKSDSNAAETTIGWGQTFTTTGFTLNNSFNETNANNETYTSWSFRKAPGFFDIVKYTGNGNGSRQIAHNLGSIPGCLIVKRLSGGTGGWVVYHHRVGNYPNLYGALYLESSGTKSNTAPWAGTYPTSTHFSVNNHVEVNNNGDEYIAYLFAGGESTAETARSVIFDGSSEYLSLGSTSDFAFGTGDFTFEAWVKPNNYTSSQYIFSLGDGDNFSCGITNSKWFYYSHATGIKYAGTPAAGQWTHFAVARSSATSKLFINGIEKTSWSDSVNFSDSPAAIGRHRANANYYWNGNISNVRVVKGTAVYTSSFRPPTEPLTNITNTKLLCCNHSSQAGSTVTPGVITSHGNSEASTHSPFDDPEGFQFGADEDQNIIKCGSYVGNGSATGPEINVGFEPQWVLYKCTDSNESWTIYDSMRGIITGPWNGNEKGLYPNSSNTEEDQAFMDLTPTGYNVTTSDTRINGSSKNYIYIAIRRSDGYVGKPPLAGTDAFAMDTGAGSSTIPNFDSGFPVDFAFEKTIAGGNSWSTGARLLQGRYLYLDTTMVDSPWAKMVFDSNTGWNNNSSYGSGDQSWMWKRGAGFDVVTWLGTNGNVDRRHNLGRTPEMIIFKDRSATRSWRVYHKGLNGGTNPEYYAIALNSSSGEGSNSAYMNATAPTSTTFVSGNDGDTNGFGDYYIALLFASVEGISKVGYYDGSGAARTITTGFQPRFLILKSSNTGGVWFVLDTTRGWAAGNDNYLQLNANNAQSQWNIGEPTATGFTLSDGDNGYNGTGYNYIYYAHA